MCALIPNTHTD